jgi:hypothetical protein
MIDAACPHAPGKKLQRLGMYAAGGMFLCHPTWQNPALRKT